jgi:hypothetical protein
MQLLKESATFALTWQHWANSIALIGVAIALTLVGSELDRILELDGLLSGIASFVSGYLTLVVFPIGWYRAIGSTGRVRMDYGVSRRTWHYVAGCLKIAALIVLFAAAILIIWAIAGFDLPKLGDDPVAHPSLCLIVLAIQYIAVRFGFVFPAAANDEPMTLGDALDASSSIQWPLLGAILIFELIGTLAGYVMPDTQDMSRALTYLTSAAAAVLLILLQGFTVAATGIAYKQVRDSGAF